MLRNFVPSKERRDAKKQAMLFTDMYVFEEDIDSNDVELFQTPIKIECPEVRCTLFRPMWVGMLPPEMVRETYKYFSYEERAKNLLKKHPKILDPDSGLQDFFHCREIEKIFIHGFMDKVSERERAWGPRKISKSLTDLLPRQRKVKYIDQYGHNVVYRYVHPVIKVLLYAATPPRSFRSFQPVRNAINHLMNITTNSPFDAELRRIGYNLIASIIIFIDTVEAKRQRVANEKAEKAKIRAEKRAKQKIERDAQREAEAAAWLIQEEERLALAAQERAARNAAREQAKADRLAAAAQAKAERIAAAAQAKEERRAAAAQAKALRKEYAMIEKLHARITAKEAKEAAKAAKVAEKEAAKEAKRLASIEAKAAKVVEKEAAKEVKRLASIEAKAAKVAEKEAAKAAKVAEKEAAKEAKRLASIEAKAAKKAAKASIK